VNIGSRYTARFVPGRPVAGPFPTFRLDPRMTPFLRLAACFVLAAAAVPAAAQGDRDAGRQKAYTCTGCHGIAGYKNVYPHYHVPKIGGQNYQYLVAALNAYRTGERTHPTMRAQAEGYSSEDIADIATYLSSLQGERQ
jgi:cytochrome c553